jgi:hypothetical protein
MNQQTEFWTNLNWVVTFIFTAERMKRQQKLLLNFVLPGIEMYLKSEGVWLHGKQLAIQWSACQRLQPCNQIPLKPTDIKFGCIVFNRPLDISEPKTFAIANGTSEADRAPVRSSVEAFLPDFQSVS